MRRPDLQEILVGSVLPVLGGPCLYRGPGPGKDVLRVESKKSLDKYFIFWTVRFLTLFLEELIQPPGALKDGCLTPVQAEDAASVPPGDLGEGPASSALP